MNIIFLNKAIQSKETAEPQLINNTLYYWTVNEEWLMAGETIREWVERKTEYLKNLGKEFDVIGIYDVSAYSVIVEDAVMMVRYAILKNGI